MLRLTAIALVSVAFTQSAAGDCAMMGLTAKVMTKPNVELPSDGGILVVAEPQQGGKLETGDAAIVRSWRFKGNTNEPTFDSLAPGLAVIRLPMNASGRAAGGELVDGTKSLVVVKATDAKRALLPAPQIKNIVVWERVSRRISGRVDVTLDAQPAGAAFLVLADAKGKPRSWGLINPANAGAPSPGVISAYQHHDCYALPNGTVQSKVGELVTVMFVDEAGRVSPPSKPFKIAKSTTP